MEAASWLIPYTSGLLKLDSVCLKYLTQRKDNRQWLGMMDSLIALAYLRFRPGAKLHVNGFKITNDHSHNLQIRDYQLDLQGLKRSILGGSSMDLLNLKTPIYYSYQLLEMLDQDDQQILLQLALESVVFLIEDTYANDLSALDYLQSLKLLLTKMLETYGTQVKSQASPDSKKFPDANLEMFMCLKPGYKEHPLTIENFRIWQDNMPLLKDTCHQFKQAYDRYLHGGNYEDNLVRIRDSLTRVRHQMNDYVNTLEKI